MTPKQREYLKKIRASADTLLGIINDILDFSKIEAGKLAMEAIDFNLEEVLDNLATLVTVKAREKEHLELLFATSPEVPRFLLGDPLRLGQVLINLANNAVKFTESGEIVVATEPMSRQEDRVTLKFSVKDTGIGLTSKQRAKPLSGLHPGRHVHDPEIRRHRVGPDHQQTAGGINGRRDLGGKRTRPGEHLCLYRHLRSGQRPRRKSTWRRLRPCAV